MFQFRAGTLMGWSELARLTKGLGRALFISNQIIFVVLTHLN